VDSHEAPGAGPRFAFPQHRSYADGTIRPSHRTQAQQDADVRRAYAHWKPRYLVKLNRPGAPRYRIAFGPPGTKAHGVTVSEGQGYGMLIVALMAGHERNARAIFDGLWRFVRDNPSEIDGRLMAWRTPDGGMDRDSAFDGDADIALALLLADSQWGSDDSIDYRAAARRVLAGIADSTIGPRSHLPLLGDWVDPNGEVHSQYTPRSSDFMPLSFRVYATVSRPAKWAKVVRASQSVISALQRSHSPKTGLLPDFIQPVSAADHTPRPADENFLEGFEDDDYYYNAGRDPWRIGMDGLIAGDRKSLAQVRKISRWAMSAAGGDPQRIRAGYELDGTPLEGSNYFTTFFAAPLAVAAMTLPSQQKWLDRIYDSVRSSFEGYYEDSVTLLCLLVMTGNFWIPAVD
jgi:endo-1,4-beta-D-glucanase Y